jgi:hypothetical protein
VSNADWSEHSASCAQFARFRLFSICACV